ncbi:MAG TPA: hypothetical protein VEU31_11495 [Candidatus Acidoferrales bacterium]|nr:hypothetical protein [Candidatus Acidoferrales bacterium]
MSCPICSKRKPQRYCPAKMDTICAVCCGTEREVTIDCTPDCPYLAAAHRYEEEHRKPIDPASIPFADAHFPRTAIDDHENVVVGIGLAILKFAAVHPDLNDSQALHALQALAETTRTLTSGIYFERPPDAPLSRALYDELAKSLAEIRQREAERAGFPTVKDSEVFYVLVFLLRIGTQATNGRPRSRMFLEFLRSQYPAEPEVAREQPRIIVP